MSKFGDPDYWIVPFDPRSLVIPHRRPDGVWVDCTGNPLDPQPSWDADTPSCQELDEDDSVEFVLNYDDTEGTVSATTCDLSTCTVLHSLSAEDRSLREQLKELREKHLAEHARRKKERKKRLKAEAKLSVRHETRERILEKRIEDDRKRMRRLAEKNQQLSEENKRLVRAVLSRSIGFDVETSLEEMDHVLDALTWWCVASGEDVDHRADYWEMWNMHDAISEEVLAIVKEYDENMKRRGK